MDLLYRNVLHSDVLIDDRVFLFLYFGLLRCGWSVVSLDLLQLVRVVRVGREVSK